MRVSPLLYGELPAVLLSSPVRDGHRCAPALRRLASPTADGVYLACESENGLLESGLLREKEANQISGRNLKPSFGGEGLLGLRVPRRCLFELPIELRLERSSPTFHRHRAEV
jgi:hypothetical protein